MAFEPSGEYVIDTTTTSTWTVEPTDLLLWDEAVAAAPSGFRLPTLDELQSLIADQRAFPESCATAFGTSSNLPTDWFWVYKIDPAHEAAWQASEKTPADAEKYALEKPGHVAALFVWQGFKPWNNRRIKALGRYIQYLY